MSWIRSIAREQADPTLHQLFDRIEQSSSSGQLASLWQGLGLDPAGLERIWALYRALMRDPAPLSRAQVEAIAVVVSATNGCGYCVAHHGPKLAAALGNDAVAHAVALDYREADLPARDRVLLDHAVALTCEPEERTAADIERLREYGFDDAAILKATEITAYYNLTNRLVQGLGVRLEANRTPWEFEAQE
ncbi:MAG TPA: peroxidase-related enzyme [Candidatus Sulfotelmatobacter sp.]|nr:peroxidase-related enzyme [Candidatus Sulfotelmatobacter sp.]